MFAGTQETQLWSKDLGGAVAYPVIAGESIFVDVANAGPNGNMVYGSAVAAYDRRSGALQWGPNPIGGTYNFGALSYDAGTVFALNFDGQLYAFDAATGQQRWMIRLPQEYAFTSPPTATNGTVYVGGSGSGGKLYAVDETTGGVDWIAGVMNR